MTTKLEEILLAKVKPHWESGTRKHNSEFNIDFAEHIIGAAISFYENESWTDSFRVWQFHIYPIPAKSWEDAKSILVRVYDIWEPIEKQC
jgi:hypothetical protein